MTRPALPRQPEATAAPGPAPCPRPSSRLRRCLFWLLLTASLGLSAWWVHYLPYDEASLYNAIPAHATIIVQHRDLGERWPTLIRTPLIRNLAETALTAHGFRLDEPMLESPEMARWIESIAGRNVVLAYVPFFGERNEAAWVMASWAGPAAQRLRWTGLWTGTDADARIDLGGGEVGWVVRDTSGAGGNRLSWAIVDSVLLACWTRDPEGVRHLVHRKKRGAAPPKILHEKMVQRERTGNEASPFARARDRVWLRSFSPQSPWGPARPVRLALADPEPQRLAGWIGIDRPAPWRNFADTARPTTTLEPVKSLLGSSSAALLATSLDWLQPILAQNATASPWETVHRRIGQDTEADAPFFVSLCRTEHDGSIIGIRAPVLLAGVPLQDPERAPGLVSSLLDLINAQWGLGLIPKTEPLPGGNTAMVLESVNENTPLQLLAENERPAFAVHGRWLVFSTSLGTLKQLLWRQQETPDAPPPATALAPAGAAGIWTDLDATLDALTTANTLLEIMSRFGIVSAIPSFRQELTTLAAVRAAAGEMNQVRAWLDDDPSRMGLHFEWGVVLGAGVEPAQP